MGHAESHSRSRRGIDKFLAFRQLDRERFLHEHVLAGLDRLPRHGKVQVVRQADRHGADLRVGDQLPGIQVRPHAVGLKRPQQRGLGIGHGHQAPGRRPPDSGHVDLADLAQANHAHCSGRRSRMACHVT